MTTAADVVVEARTWIGTPYAHQHRTKGVAVDCLGLVIGVGRVLGLLAPDFDVNGYSTKPDGVTLMAGCDEHMNRVNWSDRKPGHVLLLRFAEEPQHTGILGEYWHGEGLLTLIHAWSAARPEGRVVEQRLMQTTLMTPLQVYAFRGVEY